jgi:hypothetical protein
VSLRDQARKESSPAEAKAGAVVLRTRNPECTALHPGCDCSGKTGEFKEKPRADGFSHRCYGAPQARPAMVKFGTDSPSDWGVRCRKVTEVMME